LGATRKVKILNPAPAVAYKQQFDRPQPTRIESGMFRRRPRNLARSGFSAFFTSKAVRAGLLHSGSKLGQQLPCPPALPPKAPHPSRHPARGRLETAGGAFQSGRLVFALPRSDRTHRTCPYGRLRGALPKAIEKHIAALANPPEVGTLLHAVDVFRGTLMLQSTLKPSAGVRPARR